MNTAVLENVVLAAYTIVALALALAAWRSWHYTHSRKVMLLASGFTVLLLKGVFLSVGLFLVPAWESLFVPSLLLDLAVLVLFYFAVLRRST